MFVYLMGVSGSGKSTIGPRLAELLDAEYIDGDDYHSAANKAKMAGGAPLTDEDRRPWLGALNALAKERCRANLSTVIACSALKHIYREWLRAGLPANATHFVLLEGSRSLIATRLAQRSGHFMNPDLLTSQFNTLEPPQDAVRVVNDRSVDKVAEEIVRELRKKQIKGA